MPKLNCLIIEDQIPAQDILIRYIEQVPNLTVLGVYISPLEAISVIENGAVDILFLDVHLPKLSGIELLKSLNYQPNTILTTGFSDYAVEGFELDVVDYLLKPFSFERFLKAVSKVPQKDDYLSGDQASDLLFVRNKGQIKKIEISTILYIEAKGDFLFIHHQDGRDIANISLQKLLLTLGSNFAKCHKSYVVNLGSIDKIYGNQIIVGTKNIPIGRTCKSDLMNKLKMI